MIACLRSDDLTAPWLIDGPMNRRTFKTRVQTQLAPTLQPSDVVILDNLSSYKSATTAALLKKRGAWCLFLPPYSPDLNPIEMTFAKLKANLRRIRAMTSMPSGDPSDTSATATQPTNAGTTSKPLAMRQIKRTAL